MPLASTLWPISGLSVVVIPAPSLLLPSVWPAVRRLGSLSSQGFRVRAFGSGVVAEDEVGHAARLLLSLDLVSEAVDHLGGRRAVGREGLHLGDHDVHSDAAAHPQRRGEPDPVEAVVEDHAEALDRADLPEHSGGHAQGQEPVLHRRTERSGLGPFGIDVDPLVVTGQRRERLDVVLPDRPPAADADLLADAFSQPLEAVEHHRRAAGGLGGHWFTHRRHPPGCRSAAARGESSTGVRDRRVERRVSCSVGVRVPQGAARRVGGTISLVAGGSTHWQGRSVISKVVSLLDAFGPTTPELSLGELSRITGLPVSTTYRLASELREGGGLGGPGGAGYPHGVRQWGGVAGGAGTGPATASGSACGSWGRWRRAERACATSPCPSCRTCTRRPTRTCTSPSGTGSKRCTSPPSPAVTRCPCGPAAEAGCRCTRPGSARSCWRTHPRRC